MKANCDKTFSLAIVALSKRYGNKDKNALDFVNFSLTPGLYGLLGPNGAGKSTLINIITGSLSPTEGKVLWDGKSTAVLGEKFRAILGYMPQQ
ncbi:MAG: ATP-binding cassette domain-containing protein, partial [Oscillospiraceae bacterium]